MMRVMTVTRAATTSCHGHRSPWKKRARNETREPMMPHTVLGRKCRMMPVIKQPKLISSPWKVQ